ncbi:acyl-CoA dehydrogenase [Salmonella enterica]|uniref:acyl-CoA dehydrogenase n=1 Tax=Citrobacter freundii TaxID=546 RepID=UPI0015E91C82|nr:acyl-CoA dehydrogenase [Citrobacter freundii]EJX3081951.1 acyl-CoA dehydrogenase [Salmonella enterica]ELG9727969.1 acyl-CoA dehydrogenase [Salmonella enterica subsp. enterica serovar Rough O:z29]HCM1845808.1 acyl-CoA dehydrogenase [Salmonella enterica subsp. diarizonae serovar 16:z10:e,n,x,z15]EJX3100787.1 acyl-CoA dehydrogenase [Salmonella enterica]EJX3103173.1 acyl-CoA dehydrogenase [Salmonella enterica]
MMRNIIVTLLLAASLPMAHAGEYVKRNGALSLSPGNDAAEFNINASHGNASGVCNMEGVAESVGAGAGQRNRWVYSDSSSACVAVISELKDGSVNVMTRSCENYCGISAVGSMDGKYINR